MLIVQFKQSPISRQLGFLVVLLGFLFLPACSPLYYHVEPVEFRIVDSETGQPIKEAFVSVSWDMMESSYEGWASSGIFTKRVTSSDSNGNVYIQGWHTGLQNIFSSRRAHNVGTYCRIVKSGFVTKHCLLHELFSGGYSRANSEDTTDFIVVGGMTLVGGRDGEIKLHKLPLEPKERYRAFKKYLNELLIDKNGIACSKDSAVIQHGLIKQILLEESLARNAGIYTYYEIPRDATGQFTTDEVEACKAIAAGERYSDDKCVVGDYCRKPMRARE